MRVIIAGGGIGGLTTALCCLHFGHEAIVLEQADEFGEVGAGIQLPPNAMKVLSALGLQNQITAKAFCPEAIETRMGISGTTIFNIPLTAHSIDKWGAPYLHIHRADYIAVLVAALQVRAPEALRLNAQLARYDQTADRVTVTLANGEHIHGDVLIGADGIHSKVREQLLGPEQPRFTGNVAWRTVVPIQKLGADAPPPTACAWMGKGRHAVTYQLRGGELANFVGVVERDDWTVESWTEQGSKAEAAKDFAGWHPMITRLIAESENMFRWALFDRQPLPKWTEGRVAILGDAAHPMLPFLAQGAAMATEDAWVLASTLTKYKGLVPNALQAYQDKRLPRTSKVQAGSRANAKTFHKTHPLAQLATYGPMWLAGKVAPAVVRQRLNYLYTYDPTAE
jgi:salicylate hydroxylase